MRSSPLCLALAMVFLGSWEAPAGVRVEVEEEVYTLTPPNNGSGPLWSAG